MKPSGKPSALGSIGVDGGDDRVAVLAVGDPCLYIITKNGHLDDVRGDGRGRREGQEPAQGHASCAEFEEREAELVTVRVSSRAAPRREIISR